MTTTEQQGVRLHYYFIDGMKNVGINKDGSLWNPNGYPEDRIRVSIDRVLEQRRQRRSAGAKRAAQTRKRRQEQNLYNVVQRLMDGGTFIPANNCEICGKRLDDPQSKVRGIGSDCWQRVLTRLEASERVRDDDSAEGLFELP
jgi:hypothetical protein